MSSSSSPSADHVAKSTSWRLRQQHDYFSEQLNDFSPQKDSPNGRAQEESGPSKTVTEVRKYVGRLGLTIGRGSDRDKSHEATRALPAQEPKKTVHIKMNDRSSLSTEDLLREKQSRVIRCVSLILNMPSELVTPALPLPCMDLYPDSVLQGKFELTEMGLVALSYLARRLQGSLLDFRFCAEEFPLKLWEFKCYYFKSIPTLERIVLGYDEKSDFQLEPYQKCLSATGSKVCLTAEIFVDPLKTCRPQQAVSLPTPAQLREPPLSKPPAAAAIHLPQEEALEAR